MSEDDVPGYLMDAIRGALANGLTGLTMFRIGTETIQWQASSRWRGREGYSVHILPDFTDAAMAALGAHRLSASSQDAAPKPAAVASVFD
ncbi:hypothetical protein [Methylorubrum zatmanii]